MSLARGERELWVDNFIHGYLDTPESDTLPEGATPDAKNAMLYSINLAQGRASMGRRLGSSPINATVLAASKRVDGLFDFRRPTAAADLLSVCNGVLSSVNVLTGVTTTRASGWTAGRAARMATFRGNAIVHDGAFMQRWDGTTAYDVGFAAPSSITNMAAGAGALTGSYEAFYTWYNSAMDHDSSPSATTTVLALVAQGRTHTKPGGSVPTAATHWRAWVRRTDTNELTYYLTATVAVATAAATETISEAARRGSTVAPQLNDNDPPPGAFAVLFEMDGYGFGILADSDSVYISKVGDLESWHPKNKFPISRATGDSLCWGGVIGDAINPVRLVGTSHATWKLEGDKPPFRQRRIKSRYGNVSQDAWVEVDDRLYGWDRVRGPYVTDLVAWTPLADQRIKNFIKTIDRTALSDIRCVHLETENLVLWAVPTASTRRQTLIAYHTLLGCWLPPITGLEYGSLTTFIDSNGDLSLYVGDYWGRVWKLFDETKTRDAPATGTVDATVTAATSSTVSASAATFYTTGSGLVGAPVFVRSPAGTWQIRRIASNTGTQITIDTINGSPWSVTPAATGWTVYVGGIEWYWYTPWLNFKTPARVKSRAMFYLQVRTSTANVRMTTRGRFNDNDGNVTPMDLDMSVPVEGAALWGTATWGTSLWGGSARQLQKRRVTRSFQSVQLYFENFYPDEAIVIPMFGFTADELPARNAPSSRVS